MDRNIINNEFPFDDIGGIMSEPLGNYTPYNIRKMIKYCNEKILILKN